MKIIKGSKNSGKTNVMREFIKAKGLKGLRVRCESNEVDYEDLLNRTGLEFGGTMGMCLDVEGYTSKQVIEKVLAQDCVRDMEIVGFDIYVQESDLPYYKELEEKHGVELVLCMETNDEESYFVEYAAV